MTNSPEHDSALDELVERTRGFQPWRRVMHATNGIAIAIGLTWIDPPRWVAVGALGTVFVGLTTADLARLRVPRLNQTFFRLFSVFASPREARGIASSTWYMLGATVSVALFHGPAAVSGILVLALADPAASYLGRRWGKRPFLGGTLEGSAVFVFVTLAILLPRHPWLVALPAAGVAMLAERRSWPVDDNVAVPVVTAAVIVGLGAFL